MRVGFLIIDMQAVYLEDLDKKVIEHACAYINHVSGLIRDKGHVVIHIQDVEGMLESNRESFGIIPEVRIDESDLKVSKESSNAFWQTELEQILLEQNVELVIIAGFAAEHCVLFTYNGAIERGFKAVLLQNGILSTHADIIASTYRDRNLISHTAINYLAEHSH
ncbi:cysteine hydrolase family protein [Paenibacillus montanisoli]|uniref:Cysteine hydrolase n=1 Tax=Paenibacillus montanisoli TaxID=2081970 RepID=A0A328TZA4_9BACL|nr:isochorismatase family cysteine hydrolase [Paenibacillus montanisoli]RAP75858.1 cysteine hydrolase [Paenibacillus montanisoli]